MGKYQVLARVSKPYALSDGDVVTAQPGRVLVIGDHLDNSMSIVKGCRSKLLSKIVDPNVVVIEPAPMVPVSPVAEAAHAATEALEEKLAPVGEEEEPAKDVSDGSEDVSSEAESRPSGTKRGKWQNKSR